MPKLYGFELAKAADILVRDLFKLKKDEIFVITADTESNERVVEATASVAFTVGAKPLVLWNASPLGVGKAADPMLPSEALIGALNAADAWVEFNNQWIFYSSTYDKVVEQNKKLRYLNLVGMNPDMMVRCIGRVDIPLLEKFMARISRLTVEANEIQMTTPAGNDITFKNVPDQKPGYALGYADEPGIHMLGGQIFWRIDLDSLNGKIVYDGSVNPPLGLLKNPIEMTIEKGDIVNFEGGSEAAEFEAWLRNFDDPNMLKMAHVCYGFNPGAKLTGDVVEDERIWGCTEWGIGNMAWRPAASHTDGICLNTSVWLDGKQLLDKGRSLDPELAEVAKKLGKY
jgi:leucyl aminopeptidase (aminopeptidase T)